MSQYSKSNQYFYVGQEKKASAPTKPNGVSDDIYEDAMEGMQIILFAIYYCKMFTYFCLNEFLHFAYISIDMFQRHFPINNGLQNQVVFYF